MLLLTWIRIGFVKKGEELFLNYLKFNISILIFRLVFYIVFVLLIRRVCLIFYSFCILLIIFLFFFFINGMGSI